MNTLEEIRAARFKTEKVITEALRSFESDTGMRVNAVILEYDFAAVADGDKTLAPVKSVKIAASLP
jgi:hypothetical protein